MRDQRMVVLIDADTGQLEHARVEDKAISLPTVHTQTRLYMVGVDRDKHIHGVTALPEVPLTTVWLDEDAMVRVRDADGQVVFTSRGFEQEEAETGWWFRDPASGDQLRHSSPVPWNHLLPRPKRLRVEDRPMDINLYIHGVLFIRELFTASVRVDHPVHLY